MIDLLLIVMAFIWGTNYSIIKFAFAELSPEAFNALRMSIASVLFLTVIAALRVGPIPRLIGAGGTGEHDALVSTFRTPAPVDGRDFVELIVLGLIGHFLYQFFFIGGLALTTVSNSSLMLAATPLTVALVSALMGRERIGSRHWAGAALSLTGIYLVVSHSAPAETGRSTLTGDLMMAAAVICWAFYTIGARRLVARHSPVAVTGLSMAMGTLLYVPLMWRHVRLVDWASVSAATWLAVLYSAAFALCVAYTIWYAGVRQVGSARTSLYSNLIPIVAMATAVVFLGEPMSATKVAGASAVLIGVALARSQDASRSVARPEAGCPEP